MTAAPDDRETADLIARLRQLHLILGALRTMPDDKPESEAQTTVREAADMLAARQDGRRQGFINKPIDPILTVTIAIDRNGNVYEDTQTHGSKWADVYRAFHAIKAEIERQIAERKNCPFIPTKSALPLPGDAPAQGETT